MAEKVKMRSGKTGKYVGEKTVKSLDKPKEDKKEDKKKYKKTEDVNK